MTGCAVRFLAEILYRTDQSETKLSPIFIFSKSFNTIILVCRRDGVNTSKTSEIFCHKIFSK